MKLAAVMYVPVVAAGIPLNSGQYHAQDPPCRVAVAISGDPRSFIGVHRSFRRHVVEPIKEDGCQVDVFAYAMLEDDMDFLVGEEEEDNLDFVQELADIEVSFKFLAPIPIRVVWHQDQAGLILNSCPGSPHYCGGETASSCGEGDANHWDAGAGSGDDSRHRHQAQRDEEEEAAVSVGAYWRLYGSLAAYQMAVQKEGEENEDPDKDDGFAYDWIVSTRFDVAWLRSLPALRAFSREAVWVGAAVWPISDDFALVPRAFADRYFSAVSAFHSCDGGSWPPREAWWQPDCGGGGFQESVLFRHLHANDVAYRPYPMFGYYTVQPQREGGGGSGGGDGERGDGNRCDGRTAADHDTTCILLGAAGLLPSDSSRECNVALSEYADLRCRTLTDMHLRERAAPAETFLRSEDPTAWEVALVGAPRDHQASKVVWEEGEESQEGANVRNGEAPGEQTMDALDSLHRIRAKLVSLRDAVWIGLNALEMQFDKAEEGLDLQDLQPLEFGQSQQSRRKNEELESEETRYSWTIHSQDGCRIEEYPGVAPHVIRSYSTEQPLTKEMALATMCLAHQLSGGDKSAGGASDFSMMCSASRSLELVMVDVLFRSEELGVCTADGSSGFTGMEHVQRFFASPSAHCVGYGDRLTKTVNTTVAAATSAATVVTKKKGGARDGHIDGMAPIAVAAKITELEVAPSKAAAGEGSGKTELGAAACPSLLVQRMDVQHPKDGAVYWEGPVNVSLEVTLTGSGVQNLDLRHVHACADTESSWPIQDWSRFCVSLERLGSPDLQPSLVFGSTIGVVEGSVSLRDARPGCFPAGSLRGGVLPMAEGLDGDQSRLASTSMRFKIIHHESTFQRRGRPFGPGPLGRGLTSVQDFIRDLEREAEEEAGAAFEEMESYLNFPRGVTVELSRERCSSRLNLNGRGSALVSSGHQVQFYADQLEWMISDRKLPPEMAFAVDRMRELQSLFPDDSSEAFVSTPQVLDRSWPRVGPFLQKGLSLPMPPPEKVVSTAPLYTWEYDEIPWMEALNPDVDWHAVEEAYLGNQPVPITHVDGFFSPKALAALLNLARGNSIFVENRANYIGAYPSEGMSHAILYQIAEEAAERLPRILGRDTPGWPLVQTWFYMYGGNDGEICTHGIKVHADTAKVNVNVWLAPDSANLGSVQTGDGGGLTVFHAKPPADWDFLRFNADPSGISAFLRENRHTGSTSVPFRQNRALLFDSMLFHQSDPFRFKKGFENRRLNLTFLFGRGQKTTDGENNSNSVSGGNRVESNSAMKYPPEMREVRPGEGGQLYYCL